MSGTISSKKVRAHFRKHLHQLGKKAEPVIDYLCTIYGSPWFKNVGKANKRDVSIVRIHAWKTAESKLSNTYLNKAWMHTHDIVGTIAKQKKLIELIVESRRAFFSLGLDKIVKKLKPSQRLAYMSLSQHIGYICPAIFMKDTVALAYLGNAMAFFCEGHWPCGVDKTLTPERLIVF